MKKPKRTIPPKPTPEAPQLTFEEAIAGVLKPWFEGKDLAAGTRIASAKDAAAHGLLAALNVNEGQRGVVRILVQAPEQKREVINFLTAFLTDAPQLKKMLKRTTPDGFHLNGGVSIAVDTNSARLGKDVIATIVLDPTADKPVAFRFLHYAVGRTRADYARMEVEILDEMVANGEITPDQRSRVFFARWRAADDPKPKEYSPHEPGPGSLEDHKEHGQDHIQHHEGRVGLHEDVVPHARDGTPDPDRLESDREARLETERRYHEAIEARRREEINEKLAEAQRRFARSIA